MSNDDAPEVEHQPGAKMTDEELQARVKDILEDEKLSKVDKCRDLHELGFNRKQHQEVFNFPTSTVYYALPAKPEGDEGDNGNHTALTEHRFPVTIKGSEVIMPEAIIDHYLADGSPEWRLRIEGMALLRLAQKMNRDDAEIMKAQSEAYAKMVEPTTS